MRSFIIGWFVALFFTSSAYPWGVFGHDAIGKAARTMLTPEALTEIQKILGNDDLVYIGMWLDNVRELAQHHSGPLENDPEAIAFSAKFLQNVLWHFVNLPVGFATYSLTGPFSCANDWDKILVVKVAKSPEQLADLLREEPLIPPTLGDSHAWPMKWVEDSEKVAVSVYAGLQFRAAKLKEDDSFDRINITFPSGSRAYFRAEVAPVQIQLKKAAAHLAQLLNAIQYEP